MDGVTELAMHIKGQENPAPYTPMFGTIIALPKLKIRLGDKVLLDADDVKATFDLYETREHDNHLEYIHLGKEAVLLPYSAENKFVVIGVVR